MVRALLSGLPGRLGRPSLVLLVIALAAGPARAQDHRTAISITGGWSRLDDLTPGLSTPTVLEPGWTAGLQLETWLPSGRLGFRTGGSYAARSDQDGQEYTVVDADVDLLARIFPARAGRLAAPYALLGLGGSMYRSGEGSGPIGNGAYGPSPITRATAVGGLGVDLGSWRVGLRLEAVDRVVLLSLGESPQSQGLPTAHNVHFTTGLQLRLGRIWPASGAAHGPAPLPTSRQTEAASTIDTKSTKSTEPAGVTSASVEPGDPAAPPAAAPAARPAATAPAHTAPMPAAPARATPVAAAHPETPTARTPPARRTDPAGDRPTSQAGGGATRAPGSEPLGRPVADAVPRRAAAAPAAAPAANPEARRAPAPAPRGRVASRGTGYLYTVELGALLETDTAREWADRLRRQGLPVWTTTVTVQGQTFRRVRTGVGSEVEARELAGVLLRKFKWPMSVDRVSGQDRPPANARATTRAYISGH